MSYCQLTRDSLCFITRPRHTPRLRTKWQCIASPPLAYFCDVCAAQILSELELSNNLPARSPNSMISRSLNDRCANCSITSLTCYNAATQPIASNLNTWTRLWIRSIQHPSPLQRRIKTTNQPNLHQNPFNQGLLNVQE